MNKTLMKPDPHNGSMMPDFQELERARIDKENALRDEIRTKQETILLLEDENKELTETVKKLRHENERLTQLCLCALEHIIK